MLAWLCGDLGANPHLLVLKILLAWVCGVGSVLGWAPVARTRGAFWPVNAISWFHWGGEEAGRKGWPQVSGRALWRQACCSPRVTGGTVPCLPGDPGLTILLCVLPELSRLPVPQPSASQRSCDLVSSIIILV